MIGTINYIPVFEDKKPRYFAFVKYEGKSYFFHVSQFNGTWMELVKKVRETKNVKVEFGIDDTEPEKLRAKNVSIVDNMVMENNNA